MAYELPLTFEIDTKREIAEALVCDPARASRSMRRAFWQTGYHQVVQLAADLFVDASSSGSSLRRREAFLPFVTSAAVIATAFEHSDLDEELRGRTFRALSMRQVPCTLLSDSDSATSAAFTRLSMEGHSSHPDAGEITKSMLEYYAISQNKMETIPIVFGGAGFMLYQLDRAWELVREIQLDGIWKQEVRAVDWDGLFP